MIVFATGNVQTLKLNCDKSNITKSEYKQECDEHRKHHRNHNTQWQHQLCVFHFACRQLRLNAAIFEKYSIQSQSVRHIVRFEFRVISNSVQVLLIFSSISIICFLYFLVARLQFEFRVLFFSDRYLSVNQIFFT